ncbi:MAG: hypothetical protein ABL974_03925 [Prosthecobacter sp.]
MFRHKFHRTFIAMFWGWMVFSLCFPFLAWIVCHVEGRSTNQIAGVWVAFVIFSVPIILAAWLTILWPIDCIVPERSLLRRPTVAGFLGAFFGALPFALLATYSQMTTITDWWNESVRALRDSDSWLYLGGAAITGLTAALHVVIKHPRQIKPTPHKT